MEKIVPKIVELELSTSETPYFNPNIVEIVAVGIAQSSKISFAMIPFKWNKTINPPIMIGCKIFFIKILK